jgi:hypothetical protein
VGGFGTFDIVAREPKLFAAAVPVAGGGNPATAGEMKRVPFWVCLAHCLYLNCLRCVNDAERHPRLVDCFL